MTTDRRPPAIEARGPLTIQQIIDRKRIPHHLVAAVVRRQPASPK